jgi:phage terminase large subunit-like protein
MRASRLGHHASDLRKSSETAGQDHRADETHAYKTKIEEFMPPVAKNGNARSRYADLSEPPWYRWRIKEPAERAIRFIETYLRSPKGHGYGKPLKLAEFQKQWIREVLAPGVRQAILACPRGQGKSTLLAALAVWATFDRYEDGAPQVPVLATTVSQAKRAVYDVAVAMVLAEPELSSRAIVFSAVGDSRFTVGYNGGVCFPVANDPDGLQGLDPGPIAVIDEVGFQPIESWSSMVLASGKRSRSVCIGIGTPGLDKERSALWPLRQAWLDGSRPDGFSFTEYSAPEDLDPYDEDTWRIACPALDAGYQNIDALRVAIAMSPLAHFEIFHLGRWVSGVDCWLGPDGRAVWQALTDTDYKLFPGAKTWVGIDVGLKRDTTAIVMGQRKLGGKLHTEARIWVPKKDESIDLAAVMQYLRDLHMFYDLQECAYDPRLFEIPGQMLADEGLPMVEIPQTIERMSPAYVSLYEAIVKGDISHNGDGQYERQILNAVPRYNERGFLLSKNKSRGKIDAAAALAMMYDRAQHPPKPTYPLVGLIVGG